MKVAVIGSGGREHALVWKLKQSPLCHALFCLPGNAGTANICENVAIKVSDYQAIIDFAMAEKLDLVVVGPEAPLADGLADRLKDAGVAVVGVSAAAAQLESSKAFAKDFCFRHNIPCANSRNFTDIAAAKSYIEECGVPIVIKADGLAAGKGVVVAMTMEEALSAVDVLMVGDGGGELVIEDFLAGEELSFFVLSDGEVALPLLGVRDHKAAYDGNRGPNTGGMGTYAPAGEDEALVQKIMDKIAYPTLRAMRDEGMEYRGVMFMGLMVEGGVPRLIEYNVRFGDPECQVLMMLLESDLLEVFSSLAGGNLADIGNLAWRDGAAVNVVLAAENYPSKPNLGGIISLPDGLGDGVQIFHAGVAVDNAGNFISAGGRVLGVCAYGGDIEGARDKAYDIMGRIDLQGSFYRGDIGKN